MSVRILIGDCRERLRELPEASVDSVVCDPPYHLTSIVKRFGAANAAPAKVGATGAYARASKGFMGQTWDGGDVAFQPETWAEVLRVLKPGGHLVAFSGTRTYHRMACSIEDAGFEVRDQLAWIYGSGFPKSHNQPGGWGTALKPSWEPICLARKPLDGTVAGNVLKHGTGAINIDGCRIEGTDNTTAAERHAGTRSRENYRTGTTGKKIPTDIGRWPANIIHDGSQEVLAGFPDSDGQAAAVGPQYGPKSSVNAYGEWGPRQLMEPRGDSGSAARFFFEAKYSEDELLFCRAKAMLSEWSQELASSADGSSILSNEHAVFALRLAATLALPEGRRLSALTGLSTSATPSELNNLATNFTAAILSIESGCLPEWLQERLTRSNGPAPCAEIPKRTDTIAITISHWKSSGCADPVTFSITPLSSELGAKDSASASRFKYCAKATTDERGEGNNHPTVKPISLMRWLVRLITPKGGTVLDPFMGSGSTLIAADAEQFDAIGCELSADYAAIAERRIRDAAGMFAAIAIEAPSGVETTQIGSTAGESAGPQDIARRSAA